MVSHRVLATAALLVACSVVLQGCGGGATSVYDQFSATGKKALGQVGDYAASAKAHAATALDDAKVQAEALKAKGADVVTAAKKKAAAAKVKAEAAVAAAKKKGGAAYKKAQAQAAKARTAADSAMDDAKAKAATYKEQAADKIAAGKKTYTDLRAKAADTLKAVDAAKILREAKASAASKYADAKGKMDAAVEAAKTKGAAAVKKAQAAVKDASGKDATALAQDALTKAQGHADSLVAAAKKGGADVAALAKEKQAALDEYTTGLKKAEKLAATAKTTAVKAGAPAELFLLIPDDIETAPASNGMVYYGGMACLALVSLSCAAVGFRKVLINRRTLTRDTIEEGLASEDGLE